MSDVVERAPDGRWACGVQKAQASDAEAPAGPLTESLTVGEKFVLVCEGESVQLDKEKVALRLPPTERYTLRLLRVQELTDNRGVLTVTSYKVGASALQGAVLTDGTSSISLDGIHFDLKSVIDKQENPESKMYAPAAPLALPWPLWIWFLCSALFATLVFCVLLAVRTRSQRRELLNELARHGSSLTPYNQFNKDLRALNRQFPLAQVGAQLKIQKNAWTPEVATQFIDEINRCFRWYLAREFIVPAFRWSPNAILRELRRKYKHTHFYQRIEHDLRLALSELHKALVVREHLSALDGQQILDLCRKVADDVQRERREVRS